MIDSKYTNIISSIEKNVKFEINNSILPESFLKNFNNYKITSTLLLNDSNFFYNYYDIFDNSYKEIQINEHCEMISNYMNFTNIFYDLIKYGFFNGYITYVQLKLIKLIVKKINNIWLSDFFLQKMYKKTKKLPSKEELLYFFNIIEIIYYKIKINNINEEDLANMNINPQNLLNNNCYLESINNEKIYYQNIFNINCNKI